MDKRVVSAFLVRRSLQQLIDDWEAVMTIADSSEKVLVSPRGQHQHEGRSKRKSFWFRLKVLFALGIFLVGGVLFYVHFWHNHEMGSGPAGPSVEAGFFEQSWSERKVLLLGLGDSITSGFGASPGKSYFARLLSHPEDEFADVQGLSLSEVLPNLESLNRSVSGTTSIELLEFSLPKLELQAEETFGIVVMTTGGNDVIHNYGRTPPREGAMYGATVAEAEPWFVNSEKRLNIILDQVEEHFPGGCEIFLGNIYDPTDGVGDTINAGLPRWNEGIQVLERYNQIIEQTCQAREHVHLIDLHSTFLGHGIHCKKFWKSTYRSDDPFYWYYDNLEDPNNRGYDAIRRLYLNKIAAVVPERLGTGE